MRGDRNCQLSDRLVDELVGWGDVDTIAARVRENLAAGVASAVASTARQSAKHCASRSSVPSSSPDSATTPTHHYPRQASQGGWAIASAAVVVLLLAVTTTGRAQRQPSRLPNVSPRRADCGPLLSTNHRQPPPDRPRRKNDSITATVGAE